MNDYETSIIQFEYLCSCSNIHRPLIDDIICFIDNYQPITYGALKYIDSIDQHGILSFIRQNYMRKCGSSMILENFDGIMTMNKISCCENQFVVKEMNTSGILTEVFKCMFFGCHMKLIPHPKNYESFQHVLIFLKNSINKPLLHVANIERFYFLIISNELMHLYFNYLMYVLLSELHLQLDEPIHILRSSIEAAYAIQQFGSEDMHFKKTELLLIYVMTNQSDKIKNLLNKRH